MDEPKDPRAMTLKELTAERTVLSRRVCRTMRHASSPRRRWPLRDADVHIKARRLAQVGFALIRAEMFDELDALAKRARTRLTTRLADLAEARRMAHISATLTAMEADTRLRSHTHASGPRRPTLSAYDGDSRVEV